MRLLTGSSGTTTDGYRYEAYGELKSSFGSTTNDYRFTGEWVEEATGDVYLRARDYRPSNGRSDSRDSYEGRVGVPATLHKYLYAAANPIGNVDPSGFSRNQSQATTAATIVNMALKLEAKFPAANQEQILNQMHSLPFDDGSTPDYVYTTSEGWIDCQHCFNCAHYT